MKTLVNFTAKYYVLEFHSSALLDTGEEVDEYFVNFYGKGEGNQVGPLDYQYENGVTLEITGKTMITNDIADTMINLGVI